MLRRLVRLTLAAAVAVLVAGALVAPTARAAPKKLYFVLGYYPVDWPGDRTAFNALRQVDTVNLVGAFLYRFDGQGRISGDHDPQLMQLARQRGIEVHAVIHNFVDGQFNRWVASRILTDPTVQNQAISEILQLLRSQGYGGVHIDLENVDPTQRQALNRFMQRLVDRLHPEGYEVGIAVPAKTWDDPNNGWSGAFDYRALGRIVDEMALMTYDEHWAGASPGPIASLPWVRSVLEYALQTVPEEKILLGMAGYGYDWPESGGMATMIKARDAVSLARRYGAAIQWDSAAQVPYFRYIRNGMRRIVYYEDVRSTSRKLDLVTSNDIGGIALWRLGFEDPAIWPVIDARLGGGDSPPPPDDGEPPLPPGNPQTYVVRPGDTLSAIAARFRVTVAALAAANSIADPNWIRVGQVLVIPGSGGQPPTGSVTYVVRPGDSLWLIGQRFGVPWQAIARANGVTNVYNLQPGRTLVIPRA